MNRPAMDFKVPPGTRPWDSSVMKLNVPGGVIVDNIGINIRRQLPQAKPHEETADPVAIVGGGWSTSDPETYEELRQLYFNKVPIVALNGAANWLMERNLRPSLHIVMDARKENLPFVERLIPNCKYLLASQCAPELFDACAGRDLQVFHVISSEGEEERKVLDDFYNKTWVQIPGAGTIGIVALMLMRVLGRPFQHLFGIDSCYAPDGRHHSYPQPLNEKEGSGEFWCAGRKFRCAAWQASQVQTFIQVIKHHGNLLQLSIHGDGLLAHLLKTGASLEAPLSELLQPAVEPKE